MDLFVTANEVRARMALDPGITDNTDTLESAIMGAQFEFQNLYQSKLQLTETAVTDTFYLDDQVNWQVRKGNMFRLYLTRAFVRPELLAITVEVSKKDFPTNEAEWTAVDPEHYALEAGVGVVKLLGKYEGYFCRVTYKAGYQRSHTIPNPAFVDIDSTPNVPPTLPDYDTIPDWIKECIVGLAPVIFNIGPTTKRSAESEAIYRKAAEHAGRTFAPYNRNRAFVSSPIYTTA